jgi:hypothetical protein
MATLHAEKNTQHIGESQGMENHDHDLIHDLSKRLDAVWRYDQCIANADGKAEIQAFFREMKQKEQANIKQLRDLIRSEIKADCF